jgi:hypothetical protein
MEKFFKWEAYSLVFVVFAAPMNFIYPPAAVALGFLCVLVIVVMDTTFSVLITLVFLRPITEVLNMNERNDDARQGDGERILQKTKWLTLIGSTLAVSSSTVLYVHMGLSLIVGNQFASNPWLNVLVFGINADSILNDIGMLCVCGAIQISFLAPISPPRVFPVVQRKRIKPPSSDAPQSSGFQNKPKIGTNGSADGSLLCSSEEKSKTSSVPVPLSSAPLSSMPVLLSSFTSSDGDSDGDSISEVARSHQRDTGETLFSEEAGVSTQDRRTPALTSFLPAPFPCNQVELWDPQLEKPETVPPPKNLPPL